MKTINQMFVRVGLLSALVFAVAGPVYATDTSTPEVKLEQLKQECFKKHHQLMDKPGNRTVDACWRAHGYKMSE